MNLLREFRILIWAIKIEREKETRQTSATVIKPRHVGLNLYSLFFSLAQQNGYRKSAIALRQKQNKNVFITSFFWGFRCLFLRCILHEASILKSDTRTKSIKIEFSTHSRHRLLASFLFSGFCAFQKQTEIMRVEFNCKCNYKRKEGSLTCII